MVHMNGKMLARKILRMSFYWTTLEAYKDSWKTDRIPKGSIRKTEERYASQLPSTSYVAGSYTKDLMRGFT